MADAPFKTCNNDQGEKSGHPDFFRLHPVVNISAENFMNELLVWFPATDQWKARVSLRWACAPDVHHHCNIPLRRWAIQIKKGFFRQGTKKRDRHS